jgi:outer membrane receptor protein involved in Fe transport
MKETQLRLKTLLFGVTCLGMSTAWAADSVLLQPIIVKGNSRVTGNQILPELGTAVYHLSGPRLQIPGPNLGLNTLLLRAPGVAQDGLSQAHLRGEHGDVQLRINGVFLPDGVVGVGQELDPSMIKSFDLITGALPAEFGLHTAGVVSIETFDGTSKPGGHFRVEGGSFETLGSAMDYGWKNDKIQVYLQGSYRQNAMGIENPIPEPSALHNQTKQWRGFSYFGYSLDDSQHISLMAGGSYLSFQIPNNPQVAPTLNQNQNERSHYQVLSYRKQLQDMDIQISGLNRFRDITFLPDPEGELRLNNVSASNQRQIMSQGIQTDIRYTKYQDHLIKGGFLVRSDQARTRGATTLYAVNGNGDPTGNPYTIDNRNDKNGSVMSLYLQDSWSLTPQFTLTYGARFDQSDGYTSENQLSPRISAAYQLTQQTRLYAGYARYFTPVSLEMIRSDLLEQYQNTTNQPEINQNDPVRPERADYFALGMSHAVNESLQLGLNSYYKRADNQADEGHFFGNSLIRSPYTYAEGRTYGIEGSLSYSLGGFNAYGNLAYSKAVGRHINSAQFMHEEDEVEESKTHDFRLDHDQRWTGSAGISYSWTKDRIYADCLYGSGLPGGHGNALSLPAYFTVNVGAAHQEGNITTKLDLVNLFDAVYLLRDGTGIGVGQAQYGLRRGAFISVSYGF